MKLIPCSDHQTLIDTSYQWLKECRQQDGMPSIYIPAGNSPTELYRRLSKETPDFMLDCQLIQVDDLIDGPQKYLFKHYIQRELPTYEKQIRYIEEPPVQAQGAILGLGSNGHVAFHEPNVSPNFTYGDIRLSDESCRNLAIPLGSYGRSYGLGYFKNCEKILLMVVGENKKEPLMRALAGDRCFPAAHLMNHPGISIVYPREWQLY